MVEVSRMTSPEDPIAISAIAVSPDA